MNNLSLFKPIAIFLVSIFSISAFAQDDAQKKKDTELYKNASEIIAKGNKALKNEDLVEAEKLFNQALKTYPITNGFNIFIFKKLEIGDVRGANKFWDSLVASLNSRPQILYQTLTDIGGLVKYKYRSNTEDLKTVRLTKAGANFYKGDIKVAHEEMLILKKDGLLEGDGTNLGTLGETSLQLSDYPSAQIAIDELSKFYAANKNKSLTMGYSTQVTPIYLSAKLALAKGDFTNAIKIAEQAKEADKSINKMWVARVNLIIAEAELGLGNIEKARSFVEQAKKSPIYSEKSPDINFIEGLISLAAKDYNKAILDFSTNLAFKPGYLKPGYVYAQQITYTKKAEAYLGLKDFANARKSYETALIYYPDYEPAVNGLAKLEGNQIVARKTDKTGPDIKILEPTNMRGLKVVTAGKDVMIKGLASDPSGLKEVTINDTKVYAKEDGNFWGSVMLKDGVNKILIVATDLAENKTEQTFEIEKSTTVIAAAPIAVTEKQGKNYAVFIASQNYDDTTIPSLENPIADAIRLKLILKNNYNFSEDNIYSLFNPQRDDFKKKFLELREALQPEDNLVIFYAGHGIWVDKEKKGYWLLTDAQRNDVNTWLPNKNVLDMIAELPSRHTLLITDACFSGSVFKTRSIGADAPAAIKEMDNKIARVAITSGNDTEVPDESVFMKYLIKALTENKEKYLTAQKMFITQIIEAVMTESKTEPRYGTLELAGHVGGDFIFSKK
jgi:tetratricopeptide (TPR) repeat protein